MYNNYPDGMKESDIPGWNDWDTTIVGECNTADVKINVVDLEIVLNYLISIRKIVENDFATNGDNPDLGVALDRINQLITMVRNPVSAEVYNCPFNGEVDALGSGNTLYWQCPWCETEHEWEMQHD